jgi:hypothetical protein
MLASFRSFKSSVLWPAISVACVMIVFSYIFFEVLDLDGSNFPLHHNPVESSAIVSEVETNVIRPYFTRLAAPWTEISFSVLTNQVDRVYPRLIQPAVVSPFNILKCCGYRTALPRSSIPDHLPLYA